VWQQHDRQQRSAESQPHPLAAQGYNSPLLCGRLTIGSGNPAAVTTNAANNRPPIDRRRNRWRRRPPNLRTLRRIDRMTHHGPKKERTSSVSAARWTVNKSVKASEDRGIAAAICRCFTRSNPLRRQVARPLGLAA
jgi:hypothetical protein